MREVAVGLGVVEGGGGVVEGGGGVVGVRIDGVGVVVVVGEVRHWCCVVWVVGIG